MQSSINSTQVSKSKEVLSQSDKVSTKQGLDESLWQKRLADLEEKISNSPLDFEEQSVNKLREFAIPPRSSEYGIALQQEMIQDHHELDVKERAQLLRLRAIAAKFTLGVTYIYLIFVMSIVSGSGLEIFKLTDPVLITLLSTTTANIIGLMAIILISLFPRKEK